MTTTTHVEVLTVRASARDLRGCFRHRLGAWAAGPLLALALAGIVQASPQMTCSVHTTVDATPTLTGTINLRSDELDGDKVTMYLGNYPWYGGQVLTKYGEGLTIDDQTLTWTMDGSVFPTPLPEGATTVYAIVDPVDPPNDTWGFNFPVVVDFTGPTVASVAGSGYRVRIGYQDEGGWYDSTTNRSALEKTNYSLFASGGDGTFGNRADVDLTGTIQSVSYVVDYTSYPYQYYAELNLSAPLGSDVYQLRIMCIDGVHDNVGHWLQGNVQGGAYFEQIFDPPPAVTNVTSTAADGVYTQSDVIDLVVQFSEPVNVDPAGGTPTLVLDTDPYGSTNDAAVPYVSGSGTTDLVFQYTVGANQVSPELDYVGTYPSMVQLNGGTITSATGVAANLTLAEPGSPGSLGANKDIVIEDGTPPSVTGVTAAEWHLVVSYFDAAGLDPISAGNIANYGLVWAGPDGVFDTADDEDMLAARGGLAEHTYTVSPWNRSQGMLLMLFAQPLPGGEHRLTINGQAPDGVKDKGGNYLANADREDYVSVLTVVPEQVRAPLFQGQISFSTSTQPMREGERGGEEGSGPAVGDLNGDGILDVVDAGMVASDITVFRARLGLGNGSFGPQGREYLIPGGSSMGTPPHAMADFDGDGMLDLALTWSSDYVTHYVRFYPGDGAGGFGAPVDTSMTFAGLPTRSRSGIGTSQGWGEIACADINHDGIPDIIGIESYGTWLGVLYGNGDGTFAAPVFFQSAPDLFSLRVGDFNGDGWVDAVTFSGQWSSSASFGMFLNSGFNPLGRTGVPAQFLPRTDYPLGESMTSATVGDLDGDDAPDLVTVHDDGGYGQPGTVAIRLGNGDGTFATPPTTLAGPLEPSGVVIATADGDALPDIVTFGAGQDDGNTIGIYAYTYPGVGDGTCAAPIISGAGPYSWSVMTIPADFNGDGLLDFFVSHAHGAAYVTLGNPDGTFGADVYGVGETPKGVHCNDFNSDGIPDLLSANATDGTVSVLYGQGDGAFAATREVLTTAERNFLVAAANLNDDPRLELIVASVAESNQVGIFVWNGEIWSQMLALDVGGTPSAMVAADIDGDGYSDLAVTCKATDSIRIFWGDAAPDGTEPSFPTQTDLAAGAAPAALAVVDADKDGHLDLVTANQGDGTWSVLLASIAERGRSFARPVSLAIADEAMANSVVVTDLDGDTWPDLACTTGTVGSYSTRGLYVALSNGDGTWGAAELCPLPFMPSVDPVPQSLVAADFDGDGMPDLAAAGAGGGLFGLWRNNGDGTFQAVDVYASSGGIDGLCTGDFNNDGKSDLAATESLSSQVLVYLNILTNAVAAPVLTPPGGTFDEALDVTIDCATAGATIRYTTDGSTPTLENGDSIQSGATIPVTGSVTIMAAAFLEGMDPSPVSTAVFVFAPQVPVIAPNGGTFSEPQQVAVTCATPDTTIRYTLDGSDPNETSPDLRARGTVTVEQSLTLKARAYRDGWTPSGIAAASFVLQPVPPEVVPAGGSFNEPQEVTVTCATPDVTLRYSTDGSDPTEASPVAGARETVSVDRTMTLKVRAFKPNWAPSAVVGYDFTIQPLLPVIDPNGGPFNEMQEVEISCETADVTITYTTDLSDPTELSTQVPANGKVMVDHSLTLKARAFRANWTPSEVASADFALQLPAPTLSPGGGTFNDPLEVDVSCDLADATVRYTLDGTEPTEASPVVGVDGSVRVDHSLVLKAKAWKAGWEPSAMASVAFTMQPLPPTFTPDGGRFAATVAVTVACLTPDVTIRYTTDGSEPTDESTPVAPGGQISVDRSLTLKARAWRTGWEVSELAVSEPFTIAVAPPQFVPDGDLFSEPQTVTITTPTAGATLYYTLDGTDPTDGATRGEPSPVVPENGQITVDHSLTLKARGYKVGLEPSTITSADFVLQVVPPTFTPDGGIFNAAVEVALASTTTDATIYYTLDGTLPGAGSANVPSGASITIAQSATLTAVAARPGWQSSTPVTADFIIDVTPPHVVSHEPSGVQFGARSAMQFLFSESMAAGSFDLGGRRAGDVVSFTGPQGAIVPTAFEWLAEDLLEVRFAAQTQTGTYTMVIGPAITDLAGNPLDQNDNGVAGEDPQDRYSGAFILDNSGPRIIDQDPKDGILGPVDSITFTFNEPVDPASFDLRQDIVSFSGPQGALSANSSQWLDSVTLRLDFAPQSVRGLYRMVVGPMINDVFANPMDQNQNQLNGERPQDEYTAEFAIVQGPHVTGHFPFGDQVLPVAFVDVTFSDSMFAASFATSDDIAISVEGAGTPVPTVAGNPVYTAATKTFRLAFAAPVAAPGVYHIVLGPNITNVRGDLMDQDRDAVLGEPQQDRYDAGFTILDVDGPRVTSYAPTRSSGGGIDHADFTFSEAIAPDSFTVADVLVTDPTGLPITVTGVSALSSQVFRASFAAQTAPGTYRLRIGPDIHDLAGNQMNQDGDRTNGEAGDDRYLASITVDNSGPSGLGFVFSPPHATPAATIDVTFSEDLQGGSLDPADATVTGPAGACAVTDVTLPSPNVVRIAFTSSAQSGRFQFTLGPGIEDLSGNPMDQNGDGTPGDGFVGVFDQHLPDLTVTQVRYPAEARANQSVEVVWTVANNGSGIAVGSWTDLITISPAAARDRVDPVVLGTLAFSGPLAAGATYTRALSVTIPDGYTGSYWITVGSDATDQVFEAAPDTNNSGHGTSPVLVTARPAADLVVTDVVAPAKIHIDSTIQVTWTVRNVGDGASSARAWVDRVYLSANNLLDRSADTVLTPDMANPSSLTPGDDYTRTATLRVPASVAPGTYYVLVATDATDTEEEFDNEDNNVGASPSPVPAARPTPAILEVTDVHLVPPATAVEAGQTVTIQWTVMNTGEQTPGNSGGWYANGFGFDNAMVISANPWVSFSPGQALFYHRAVYRGPFAPGTAAVFSEQVTIPMDLRGTQYLIPWVDPPQWTGLDKLLMPLELTVNAPALPDLVPVAEDFVVPAELVAGRPATFSWTVRNDGTAAATQEWTNALVFQRQTRGGTEEVEIGRFRYANSGGLAIDGATAPITFTPVLPRVQAGTWNVVLRLLPGMRELDTDNNSLTATDHAVAAPVADLTPIAFACSATAAPAGSVVHFTWSVRYNGDAESIPDSWMDAVLLSPDGSVDTAVQIGQLPHVGTMADNDVYADVGLDVTLPAQQSGSFHVLLLVDAEDSLYEPGAEANNVRDLGELVTIQAPNLQAQISNPPTAGVAGQPLTLLWEVQNVGTADAMPSWADACYLSADAVLDTATDRLLLSIPHSTPLAPGDAPYTPGGVQGMTVTLPDNFEGLSHLFLVADADRQLYEEGAAEADNILDVPITVADFAPDLRIQDPVAPTEGVAGEPILINWKVYNRGEAPAEGDWCDALYLSADTTFDPNEDLLFSKPAPNKIPVPINDFYEPVLNLRDIEARLPARIQGEFYIFIVADVDRQLYERAAGEANNVFMVPTPIQVQNLAPDLRVLTVTPAVCTVPAGSAISIAWTVRNEGARPTTEGYWEDGVLLSRDNDLDPPSDVLLGTVVRTTNVDAGADYSVTSEFVLRQDLEGPYRLYVVTDLRRHVYEFTGETNNTTAAAQLLEVTGLHADLRVTQFDAAQRDLTVTAGDLLNLSWTVTNVGTTSTGAGQWTDVVYLSSDPVLDSADTPLHEARHGGVLGPAGFYDVPAAQVRLPADRTGTWYLIVKTDAGQFNDVYEPAAEDNNASIPLELTINPKPLPNLIPSGVTPQAEPAWSGQSFTLSWTESNAGNADAVSRAADGRWYATVYLSRDTYLDPLVDIGLGNTRVAGPLAHDVRAVVQRRFDTQIPNGISGPYYIIVKTDTGNEVVENDEADNLACSATPLDVQLTPPADLVVNTVSPPGAAAGYYGDMGTWGFTIANDSTTDAARGAWADSVYLSDDTTWDVFDIRVDRVLHVGQGDLEPQTTYTVNTDAQIPAVPPGEYYVLVRTDVADDVRETDETNNTSTPEAFTVLGRPINLDQAEAGSLDPSTGQVYYQIDGIEAGKTLMVTATGSRGLMVSVRFGALPTQFRSDATGDGSCTVRNTQAGTYYILLEGTGGYDLLATIAPYGITAVDPDRAGNTGEVTVRVTGSEFTADTIVELLDGGGGVIRTGSVWFSSSSELYVTFDLAGVTPGAWFVAAREPGRAPWGTVPFEVLDGGVGSLFAELVVPPIVRAGRPMTLKVVYGNNGFADVAAPLLIVRAPAGVQWRLTAAEAFHARPIQFFAASMSGDPAILRPGSRYEVLIEFQGNESGRFCFHLDAITTAADSGIDWVGFEQQVRPGANDDPLMVQYWRDVWAQFVSQTGSTAGGFVAELGHAARLHLLRRGSHTRDLRDLLGVDFAEILAFLPGSFPGSVHLVSGSGPSVAGAELVLYNPATGDAGDAISEADGTVRFLDLPAGQYQSFATNYMLSPASVTIPPTRDQVWTVTVGGGIAGRVLMASGENLSGNYVLLRHEGAQYYLGALSPDGDYVRRGLPDGRYSAFFAGTSTQTPARIDDIEVASPAVTTAPDLQCALGGTIEGVVTSLGRYALADVSVVAYDGADQAYSALTSADGSYRIGPLPAGQYTLEAAKTGYEDVSLNNVAVLVGGAVSRLDLVMPGSGLLTGSVGGIRGTIVGLPTTASVCVVPALGQRAVPATCVQQRCTGVPGTFEFGGLEPQTYDVVVVATGLCAPVPLVRQVQVQAGQIADVAFDKLPVCSGGPNTFSDYIAGLPPVLVGGLWDEQCMLVLGSHDPNDKLVDVGTGPAHAILPGTVIPYTIRFENDAKATASVQLLTITDPISPFLDPNSFEFADMEFQNIPVPMPAAGLKEFAVTVDMRPYGTELLVEIVGTFDVSTGLAQWVFSALDPLTGEFTDDPFIGFLPPNDDIHSGEGFVKFNAQPRADLASGSVIENVATIVFDWNEPMDTPLVFNTIDSEAPTSVVLDLPTLSPEAFTLTWSGQDDNGVVSYDIYVSTNGTEYSLWLPQTSATTAVFPGVPGQQYWFYSMATDWVGHRQAAPGIPASTTAVAVPTIALTDPPFPTTVNPGDVYCIEWSATDPGGLDPTITLYWDTDTSVANNVTGRDDATPATWGVIQADLPFGDTQFDWTVPGDIGADHIYLLARIAKADIAATNYTADTIGIGDIDHDGMVDSWEQAVIDNLGGGMALTDFAPGADSDGDGWTNLDEYVGDSDAANPNSAPDWRMALYLQGDDAGELVFGYAEGASAGWDEGLDIDGSNQMAWLTGPASHPYLDRSILGVGANLIWPMQVNIGADRGPVDVTWDNTGVPPDFGLFLTAVEDPERAVGPSFDMVAYSALRLTEATDLNIELVPPQVVTYEMHAGWNLLSLPCQPSDNRVLNLFGAPPSGYLCTWGATRGGRPGGYEQPATLDAKQGFWVYWAQRESLQVRGRQLRDHSVDLQAGWNLVGPVVASRLPDVPEIQLPAWHWNAATLRYERVVANGLLSQGVGYWIYCTAPVTVELTPAD